MENITDKFKDCKAGDVLDVRWDRGNGELRSAFLYYGINPFNNMPLLVDSKNFGRKPVVFFDQENKIREVSCRVGYGCTPFYDAKFSR